jgi:hypothetical protein
MLLLITLKRFGKIIYTLFKYIMKTIYLNLFSLKTAVIIEKVVPQTYET